MSQENKPEELPDEIPRRKWWLPVLIGVALLCAAIYGGRKIYGRVEPERLSRQAKALIEKGDYRGALISLSRALQINNNSQSATRTMADLMEKLELPQAVDWRRRLTELNPGSAEEAMDLAEYAIQQKKPEIASQALQQIPGGNREEAAFQSMSGLAAIQSGNWKSALDFFAEAARLDPRNDVVRYNLALAQLQSKDATERAAGWDTLNALGQSGRAQAFALRAMISRLAEQGKIEEALQRSTVLAGLSQAQFKDHIIQAELLRHLQRPEWTAALDKAKSLAEDVPADAAAVVNWYRLNGKPEDGLQWAARLDPAVTDAPLVRVARAECMTLLKQWDPLMRICKADSWAAQEYRRLAFLSRADFEKDDHLASTGAWTSAVNACAGDRGRLVNLAGMAAEWGWTPQAREALWAGADAPSPEWALQLLYRSYASEQKTPEMLRVARRMLTANENDLGAKNNVALFSLLLRQDEEQALMFARDLVEKQPANPVFLSTLAFAQLSSGMPEESLATLESLPPALREDPGYAPYFAFAYQANGDAGKAREFLARVDRKKLLPEEISFVDQLSALVKLP